jgi:hypothetical protein
MSLDLINTEDFISEIESRPVIWDVNSDGHSNKVVKTNAWQEIIAKFVRPRNSACTCNERFLLILLLFISTNNNSSSSLESISQTNQLAILGVSDTSDPEVFASVTGDRHW